MVQNTYLEKLGSTKNFSTILIRKTFLFDFNELYFCSVFKMPYDFIFYKFKENKIDAIKSFDKKNLI